MLVQACRDAGRAWVRTAVKVSGVVLGGLVGVLAVGLRADSRGVWRSAWVGFGGRLEQANGQILEVFGGRVEQASAIGLSRQIGRF